MERVLLYLDELDDAIYMIVLAGALRSRVLRRLLLLTPVLACVAVTASTAPI